MKNYWKSSLFYFIFGLSLVLFLLNDKCLTEHHVIYWGSLVITIFASMIDVNDRRVFKSASIYFFILSVMWWLPISVYWSLIPIFFIGLCHKLLIFKRQSLLLLEAFITLIFALAIHFIQDMRNSEDYAAAYPETSIVSEYTPEIFNA